MKMVLALLLASANGAAVWFYDGPMWACASTALITYSLLIGPLKDAQP